MATSPEMSQGLLRISNMDECQESCVCSEITPQKISGLRWRTRIRWDRLTIGETA